MRKTVSVPRWIFDVGQRGQYFLLTFGEDGEASVDGGHSSPLGVGSADYLIKQIGLQSAKNETRVMVKITNVPKRHVGLNRKAIEDCRRMVAGATPTPATQGQK